ncbi:MAG: c-type cytochrome [Betaproteobacteria bacterium]|nr:c-type cytochrome [Betaproteobacteria bacterium]
MRKHSGLAALAAIVLLGSSAAQAQKGASMERGKYLMDSVVACGNCHVARGEKGTPMFDKGLSGGMMFDEPPFKAIASNITPDPETGIGNWTNAQLGKAIREGVRPDGSIIGPPMPMEFYRKMSDADLASIVAYLKAQPPVKNAVAKSEYRMPLPASYGPALKKVATPSSKNKVRYGKYLADIGHCMECHTPREKGHLNMKKVGAGGQMFMGPWGESIARNLTPHDSGLKDWSDAEIARVVREGSGKDGTPRKPPMAFGWYQNISDEDMNALIAYLRSLKPKAFAGKA